MTEKTMSLLPSVLLQVCSMSNNADGSKQGMFFFLVCLDTDSVIMILSYEPSISLCVQM